MKSKSRKVLSIIIYIIIFIGILIIFFGYGFSGISEVKEAKVSSINNKKMIIEIQEFQNGDSKSFEIKKPWIINVKENDTILVRYHINNPENLYCVARPEIGIVLIVCSCIFIIAINVIKTTKKIYEIKT